LTKQGFSDIICLLHQQTNCQEKLLAHLSATADLAPVCTLSVSLILYCLRTRGPLSRAGLSAVIVLNRSTVSNLIRNLLGENLDRELGLQSLAKSNRPGMLLEPILEEMIRKHALAQPRAVVEVVTLAHGVDACVMGAVARFLDDILREPMV